MSQGSSDFVKIGWNKYYNLLETSTVATPNDGWNITIRAVRRLLLAIVMKILLNILYVDVDGNDWDKTYN